jgi:hypothetical protein
MELIPDTMLGIVCYSDGAYQRRRNIPRHMNPITRKKNTNKEELIWVLESVIRMKLEMKDMAYKGDIGFQSYVHYDDDQDCICSQSNCKDIFFLQHKLSGMTFKLGSTCIINMCEDKTNRVEHTLKMDEIIKDYKRDECKKVGCPNRIKDKRTWWGRDGYCCYDCIKKVKDDEREREHQEREMMMNAERESWERERQDRNEYFAICECGFKAIIKQVETESSRYYGKYYWSCQWKKSRRLEGAKWVVVAGCNFWELLNEDEYKVQMT